MNIVTKRVVALLANGLHLARDRRGDLLRSLDCDEWQPVLALANAHYLTPALGAALRDAGLLSVIAPDAKQYLDYFLERNGQRNFNIRNQALEIIRGLNENSIVPMALKGVLTLLDKPHLSCDARIMIDIDLVVPKAQCDEAIAILKSHEYDIAEEYPEGHHAVAEFMRPGEPGTLDLHTELIDQSYLLSADEMRSRSRKVSMHGGIAFRVPSATDRVMHALLHAQIHHRGNYYGGHLNLGSLYDFASLVAAHGDTVDWKFIVKRLQRHRLLTPLHGYLLSARELFGLPWPLSREPVMPARIHHARCMAQLHLGGLDRLGSVWGNFVGPIAWHRMSARYGDQRSSITKDRLFHLLQYLRRFGAKRSMRRLLRP